MRAAAVALLMLSAAPVFAATEVPPKTVITGKRMNVIQRGEAVEFVGNVRMVRGADVLTADRVVSDKESGIVRAFGNVVLERIDPADGAKWTAKSDTAVYDTRVSSGTLFRGKRPVKLDRAAENDGRRLFLTGDVVTVRRVEAAAPPALSTGTFAEAHGSVHVEWHEEDLKRVTEVWSDHAFYDGFAGTASFINADANPEPPRARQEQKGRIRRMKGRRIIVYMNERRVRVENNAQAELIGGVD